MRRPAVAVSERFLQERTWMVQVGKRGGYLPLLRVLACLRPCLAAGGRRTGIRPADSLPDGKRRAGEV